MKCLFNRNFHFFGWMNADTLLMLMETISLLNHLKSLMFLFFHNGFKRDFESFKNLIHPITQK